MLTEISQFVKSYWRDIVLTVLVFLAIFISFGLGYLAAQYQQKETIKINYVLYFSPA